jgi:hypothetical protein
MDDLLSCIEEDTISIGEETTITFKSDLSHINWEKLFKQYSVPGPGGSIFFSSTEDYAHGLGIYDDGFGYYIDAYDYCYFPLQEIVEDWGLSDGIGWYRYDASNDEYVKMDNPASITLPPKPFQIENPSIEMYAAPEQIAPLFDIEVSDGFSRVTVNVASDSAELEEITITENGEYTPTKDGFSRVTVNVAGNPNETFNLFARNQLEHVTDEMLEGMTEIPSYFFGHATALKSISIPEGVTKLCKDVFKGEDWQLSANNHLEFIKFPASLT